jgi:probable addiction module antidote protein
MKKVPTRPWDAAATLTDDKDLAAYLEAALEEAAEDPAFLLVALGTVARAKGMSRIARDAGVSRENLYRALSGDTSPEFVTIVKVLHALGLHMRFQPRSYPEEQDLVAG